MSDSLRERLDSALEKVVDDAALRDIIAASLEIKKQARGWCPNCRKQVQVEIDDAKAVVAAVSELVNQAKGRPGQAEESSDERIIFERVVYLGGDD